MGSYDFLDMLTIFSVLLQVAQMQDDARKASGDDVLKELQRQDREYLQKILENQQEILDRLRQLG